MADTPVVSGNELTSNPGNAALGYSSGISYDGNPAVVNPLQGMDDMYARIQEQQYKDKVQRHLEQRADQEQLYQLLRGSQQSVFNMKDDRGNNVSFTQLPQDEAETIKGADKLRKYALQKGDPSIFRRDPDFSKMYDEQNRKVSLAGLRSVFKARQTELAAREEDPEERSAILENMNRELAVPLSEGVEPTPYLSNKKVNPDVFLPKDALNDKDLYTTYTTRTKDGTQVDMSGLKTNVIDFRNNVRTNAALGVQAKKYANAFFNSGVLQDPNAIIEHNRLIDKANEDRGWIGSPHQIPHIADVMPNGSIKINTTDPAEVTYALVAPSRGALSPNAKPSDMELKQETEKAAIADKKEAARLAREHLKFEESKEAHQRADKAQEDYDASVTAKEVRDTFDKSLHESRMHNISINDWLSGYNPVIDKDANGNPVAQAPNPQLKEAMVGRGLDPKDHIFSKLNQGDQSIKEMLGVKEVPKQVYFIHRKEERDKETGKITKFTDDDDMLMALVPTYEKITVAGEGSKMQENDEWIFVNKKNAIANAIGEVKKKGGSVKVGNEINEQMDGKGVADSAPKTKVISGNTYQFENGEWFKLN